MTASSVSSADVTHMVPDYDLLTSDEVADVFRVERTTVHRWVRARRLPNARTPGGKLRFRRRDIVDLLRRTLSGEATDVTEDPVEAFARWVVSLDDVDGPGAEERRTVTLNQIIERARDALTEDTTEIERKIDALEERCRDR